MTDYDKPIKCARCDKNEATTLVEPHNTDAVICVCEECIEDCDRPYSGSFPKEGD